MTVKGDNSVIRQSAARNSLKEKNMNTLKIELPFSLSEDEAKLLLSVKLYEVGKITPGQAAKSAGFSKQAFIDVIAKYKIPVINYSPEELREELGL
jgi:predicted HTH domain antitoxin